MERIAYLNLYSIGLNTICHIGTSYFGLGTGNTVEKSDLQVACLM